MMENMLLMMKEQKRNKPETNEDEDLNGFYAL